MPEVGAPNGGYVRGVPGRPGVLRRSQGREALRQPFGMAGSIFRVQALTLTGRLIRR